VPVTCALFYLFTVQCKTSPGKYSVYHSTVTITQNREILTSVVHISQMHRSGSNWRLCCRTGWRTHWCYTALSLSHRFVVLLHWHRSTPQHLMNIVHRHGRHYNADISQHDSINQHITSMNVLQKVSNESVSRIPLVVSLVISQTSLSGQQLFC